MSNRLRQGILLASAVAIIVVGIVVLILVGTDISDTTKIGFIMTGSTDNIGWNGMHFSGASYASEKLGVELLVKENVPEESESCAEAIHQLAEEGAQMIILSSYGYPSVTKDVIDSYTDIAFYSISTDHPTKNNTSYFGRMYQARYLSGIIAGLTTESNSIGYVAAMPNSEVNRGINAFTLGVRSVNPDAVVHVSWTNSWDDPIAETNATRALIENTGADLVTYHQNQHNVAITADSMGVYSIGYNQSVEGLSDKHLTCAVWNWESMYYQIIHEYLQGNGNQTKHYWFGIETGVIGLSEFSPKVSDKAVTAVENAKAELIAGKNIFSGQIYDNNGVLRCDTDESISDDTLTNNMNWFVDGVNIYG